MTSDIGTRADFSELRYAQCWEDTDVLLRALDLKPGATLLSIASGGDNTMALLASCPEQVVALDLSHAQLAMLELRWVAHRQLDYPQLLELTGVRESSRRFDLYERCRPHLSSTAQKFWDSRGEAIRTGATNSGRFERYLRLFSTRILPLIHPYRVRMQLLLPRSRAEREQFYWDVWDTRRWRWLFKIFFSRFVMSRLGRAPAFFDYAEGNIANRLLARSRHALIELDPSQNPYLQWILLGHHGPALPYALRPENFQPIRQNLDRLTLHQQSIEQYLEEHPALRFDGFNLSDIFEYMSPSQYADTLRRLADAGTPGARLVYWNVFATRKRPPELADRLMPLTELAAELHAQDQAFFYNAVVVEEVRPSKPSLGLSATATHL